MTAPENLLGLNFKPLNFKELATVYDHLKTLHDIMCSMVCQPRCNLAGHHGRRDHNNAGDLLQGLSERISAELSELIKEGKSRTPKTNDDRDIRFYLMMSDELWAHANPESIVEEAQMIVANMPTIEGDQSEERSGR